MSGYTPGPWKVWRHSYIGSNEVYVEGANGRSVCYVIHNDDERKEQEADAALIAAAPDLLEALREAVLCIEDLSAETVLQGDWREKSLAIINAAIAQAEGKT